MSCTLLSFLACHMILLHLNHANWWRPGFKCFSSPPFNPLVPPSTDNWLWGYQCTFETLQTRKSAKTSKAIFDEIPIMFITSKSFVKLLMSKYQYKGKTFILNILGQRYFSWLINIYTISIGKWWNLQLTIESYDKR